MMHGPVLRVPQLEIVVFQWSRKHGQCQECGLPAAFTTVAVPVRDALMDLYKRSRPLCAVCAANEAANGEKIMRIEELE